MRQKFLITSFQAADPQVLSSTNTKWDKYLGEQMLRLTCNKSYEYLGSKLEPRQ